MIRHQFFLARTPEDLVRELRTLLDEYQTLSQTHITWFTHKNPYGCWICDLLLDGQTFCNYLEALLGSPKQDLVDTFITTKSSRPDDMSSNSHEGNQDG